MAVSTDLTDWTKVSDFSRGVGVPGRDPHVVWDDQEKLWLMYATGPRTNDGLNHAFVARSTDLLDWRLEGTCALIPELPDGHGGNSESMTVMRHPGDGAWILMANWQYVRSDDPHTFLTGTVLPYENLRGPHRVNIGLAGELIEWQGKWYRSGFFGPPNANRLGFTEIEWVNGGAFRVVTPSVAG